MSGGKVVALRGNSVPTPVGEPVRDVVEMLREYLDKAEAGQLRAVMVAGVMVTDSASPMIDSDFTAPTHAWDLYAGLGRLTRRYEKFLDGE